jgi:hypothetical protein
MNTSKIMLCVIGATIVTSAAALDASARAVDGANAARTGAYVSVMRGLVLDGARASIDNLSASASSRVAINPQPLPPKDDEY